MTPCKSKDGETSCPDPAVRTVFWPGETTVSCDRHFKGQQKIASVMGFALDSRLIPEEVIGTLDLVLVAWKAIISQPGPHLQPLQISVETGRKLIDRLEWADLVMVAADHAIATCGLEQSTEQLAEAVKNYRGVK